MVVFLNGLPLATLELKNPWTGQNVSHAKKQYCEDRDPKETLLQFRRCLVHFAVDPDEVWMTTKLEGKSTYFLPFNKGCDHGKGNPVNPDGHKSAYLWQEILTRHSLTNIIEHYAKVTEENDKKTGKTKQTLYFPRYHQLDVVRRLLADVAARGAGQRYLVQHSAGSGKSNSIAWLAHQLIGLAHGDPDGACRLCRRPRQLPADGTVHDAAQRRILRGAGRRRHRPRRRRGGLPACGIA